MSASEIELKAYCVETATNAKTASRELVGWRGEQIDHWLRDSAKQLVERAAEITSANERDVSRKDEFGLTDAQVDRLCLDSNRIESIADGLRQMESLPSPVDEIFESTVRPNGLQINKVRAPLGGVFFIYETRPNVTADATGDLHQKPKRSWFFVEEKRRFIPARQLLRSCNRSGNHMAFQELPCNW